MKPIQLAYSISEACGLLSVGRTTLYAAIKKGDLKTCKVGWRTLVTVEALQFWLGICRILLVIFSSLNDI